MLPLVPKHLAPIKSAYIAGDDVYAVKGHFNASLVTGCHVFTTSATPERHMRCDTQVYTSEDQLAADVGAALPGFTKGMNMMGQAQWVGRRLGKPER